ncbi:MAG: hypothetical protein A3F11_11375 [Gammaproteobacteria bacterium RIFCSPHIGHO2_12_FULL_37_14]|nr:MAG: hypothetical protein A3F11_11375 [Gammaproteobacteria bacterium RIFCSPHIGHO2_12_FULL_37_14]
MIDLNHLKYIFGDNKNQIHEFLVFFVTSAQENIQQIDQDIQMKNIKSLMFHIHKLKGSAGNSGLIKLANLCQQLEESVGHQDWITLEKYNLEIKNCILNLQNEISKIFKS